MTDKITLQNGQEIINGELHENGHLLNDENSTINDAGVRVGRKLQHTIDLEAKAVQASKVESEAMTKLYMKHKGLKNERDIPDENSRKMSAMPDYLSDKVLIDAQKACNTPNPSVQELNHYVTAALKNKYLPPLLSELELEQVQGRLAEERLYDTLNGLPVEVREPLMAKVMSHQGINDQQMTPEQLNSAIAAELKLIGK